MMSDPTRDDISFLKRVSEEGRYAPLLGGRYLIMWGAIISTTYVFQYLILSRTLSWPEWSLAALWSVAGLLAVAGMALLPKSLRDKPGRMAISNQVERWVWAGVGLSIFVFAASTTLAVAFTGASLILFDLIVAVALAGYGAAFIVVSRIAGQKWMLFPAIAAFTGTAAVPFLAGTPETYLAGAVAVALAAIVPGFILLRAEPASMPEAA